tara:strand:+ start:1024 stop:1563 length:540 start_codon:yes stop_codon:yes gene_type:complete
VRFTAVRQASIRIIKVGVIAPFDAVTGEAVTAACEHTVPHAAVVVVSVTIITSLVTRHPQQDVQATNTITADSELACIRAPVLVGLISIVTFLTRILNPVAATLQSAKGRTTIAVILIAIIATLVIKIPRQKILSEMTVPAVSWTAVIQTGIQLSKVTVIATFTGVNDPVTAALNDAST